MDAEFTLASIDTTISMKQQELAEKNSNFSKGYSKWAILAKVQGGTLRKNLKIGHFFGQTLKGYKILNTSRILA